MYKKTYTITLNCVGGGHPLPALLTSQANLILTNDLKPSPILMVPIYQVFNGAISTHIIYPASSFF